MPNHQVVDETSRSCIILARQWPGAASMGCRGQAQGICEDRLRHSCSQSIRHPIAILRNKMGGCASRIFAQYMTTCVNIGTAVLARQSDSVTAALLIAVFFVQDCSASCALLGPPPECCPVACSRCPVHSARPPGRGHECLRAAACLNSQGMLIWTMHAHLRHPPLLALCPSLP